MSEDEQYVFISSKLGGIMIYDIKDHSMPQLLMNPNPHNVEDVKLLQSQNQLVCSGGGNISLIEYSLEKKSFTILGTDTINGIVQVKLCFIQGN